MKVLVQAIETVVHDLYDVSPSVELTRPEPQFGDWSCNVALQLSKQLGRNPREIAQEIADRLTTITEVKMVDVKIQLGKRIAET